VRLQLPDPLRAEDLEAFHAVRRRSIDEGWEALRFLIGEGNNEFAGMAERDVVLGGEPLELCLAFTTQCRLEGSRRVVDPGVNHAAVMTRLVSGQL